MGRPPKPGLQYYSKDVDFYDDLKIMDLLEEWGPLGVTVYEVMLCAIYKSGYYLEADVGKISLKICRVIGGRWAKKETVGQVIDYCADIGLFDKALLSQGIITSAGVQRAYATVATRRQFPREKYWLLDEKGQRLVLKAPQNGVIAAETGVIAAEMPIVATGMRQKKTKEKERKEDCAQEIMQQFERFWEMYPRKQNKAGAARAWMALAPDEELGKKIIAAVGKAVKSPDWMKEGGKYIPGPVRYLEDRRWEDVVASRPTGGFEPSFDAAALDAEREASYRLPRLPRLKGEDGGLHNP